MKGLFTKIAAVVLGLSMATGVGVAVVANTSNAVSVEANSAVMTAGTNASSCTVNEIDGIKIGTSKLGGDMSITVPASAIELIVYAAAWNGVNNLSLTITPSDKISPTSIALTADSGIHDNSPFTLDGDIEDYKHIFTLSNLTAATTFTFTTSASKRCVVWGAEYSDTASTATTVTFTPGTDTGATSVTKSGVTVTMTTMNNNSYYQIYANQTGTFSVTPGYVITGINFSCANRYGPSKASADVGTFTYQNLNGSWSSTNGFDSVTISTTSQIRMSSLSVTIKNGPRITDVTISGGPDASAVVLAGSELTMSATVSAYNDISKKLSRNVNWTVSPSGAVTFSKATSESGEEITVTAANGNYNNVVITAASAATGFTNVNAVAADAAVITTLL